MEGSHSRQWARVSRSRHGHSGEHFKQGRLLYWNRGDGQFFDLSPQAGSGIAAAHSSRGLAIGDLDNDGNEEIVIVNMGEAPSLLKNLAPSTGNSILIRLLTSTNRDAIGARVTVTANGQKQMDEVRSGGSYISQSDFRLALWPRQSGFGESLDPVARWQDREVLRSCRRTDRNHPGRQRHHQKAALSAGKHLGGLTAVVLPLSASQHLPHEIVLRKDFEILFKRLVSLRILFCLDEAHHQHFPRDWIERVQIDCLLDQGKGLLCLSNVRQSVGEVRIGRRRGCAALQERAQMVGGSLKVAILQVSAPQRGLHQRVAGLRLLQLAKDFEIGRNVFAACSPPTLRRLPTGSATAAERCPAQVRD